MERESDLLDEKLAAAGGELLLLKRQRDEAWKKLDRVVLRLDKMAQGKGHGRRGKR